MKIVQAHVSFTSGGKTRFQPVVQVYVPVKETTANVPYVLSAINLEFGQSHVIVTADSIELSWYAGHVILESAKQEAICGG